MKRILTVSAVIIALAFVASSCGGGGGGGSVPGGGGSGSSTNYSISGKATYSGDNLPGVTISLTSAGTMTVITTTDANGNYSFSGLSNGNYTITASKSGYEFASPSQSVTVGGYSLTSQNFPGAPYVAAIVGSWTTFDYSMFPCFFPCATSGDGSRTITFANSGTFTVSCSSDCAQGVTDYVYGSYSYSLTNPLYGVYYMTLNTDSYTYCGTNYSYAYTDDRDFKITNYGSKLEWWMTGGGSSGDVMFSRL